MSPELESDGSCGCVDYDRGSEEVVHGSCEFLRRSATETRPHSAPRRTVPGPRELEELIRLAHDNTEPDEYRLFRDAVAEVMTTTLLRIINPVLEEHEDLVPHEDLRPQRRKV